MNYSPSELMACVFARALRDGDTMVMGTNAHIPSAAWRLARDSGKPHVRALIGATGTLDPTHESVPASGGDQAFLPGTAVLGLARGVHDQLRGFADVIFLGGLQVDAQGRINLAVIGDYEQPRMRGPGSIGLSLVATIPRAFLFFEKHDPRVFVETVDFISGDVLGADSELLIVTPLGVLGAAAGERTVKLMSVHPGVSFDEIQAATGFPLDPALAVTTVPPSVTELARLRTQS
mgnify:CR=1 FL=1|jgi:glutaconate CoA-transferase, subunit B